MYFERVLVYLAAFINDISLMNFSTPPHGESLYVAGSLACVSQS
jgi:hypothetical protein